MGTIRDGGTKITSTTEPRSLWQSTILCMMAQVDITADKANTSDVFIGSDRVNHATSPKRGTCLAPGDTVTYRDVEMNSVYIIGATVGDSVHWSGVLR